MHRLDKDTNGSSSSPDEPAHRALSRDFAGRDQRAYSACLGRASAGSGEISAISAQPDQSRRKWRSSREPQPSQQ